jgi:hypothetical protein
VSDAPTSVFTDQVVLYHSNNHCTEAVHTPAYDCTEAVHTPADDRTASDFKGNIFDWRSWTSDSLH